ncbi:MAG TPA: hypothetical protein VFO67_13220 [Gemmatimonadales bacterium]|nr:hypothetical protein [Gemmatimonadales bacterium]
MTDGIAEEGGRMNRVVTVVLSGARARFFAVGPTSTQELPCLYSPQTRGARFHSDRADAPGRGERAYHGRIEEEQRRHVAAIVARLTALLGADEMLELALAGPHELTRAVEGELAPALRARVIGTLRVDPKRATAATIARQTRQLLQAWTELVPAKVPEW